jgi:hypothetical protein
MFSNTGSFQGYIDVGDGFWRRNDDNYKMLLVAIFVTKVNSHWRWALTLFCHQHPQIVTNLKSPT